MMKRLYGIVINRAKSIARGQGLNPSSTISSETSGKLLNLCAYLYVR